MDDYISRKAAIDALTDYIHNIDRVMGTGKLTMYDCKDAAESVLGEDELPSADVQPVRHGHWMPCENQNQDDVNNGNYLYVCSNCNHSDIHAKTVEVPFCWFCGARMDGEQDDEMGS